MVGTRAWTVVVVALGGVAGAIGAAPAASPPPVAVVPAAGGAVAAPATAEAPPAPDVGAGRPDEASLRAADREQLRIVVERDTDANREFLHPNFAQNGPAERVLRKRQVIDSYARGAVGHDRFERTVESVTITGTVGVVMGSEYVKPSEGADLREVHGNALLQRRFTNVFVWEQGRWRLLARQATVASAKSDEKPLKLGRASTVP